MPEACSAIMHPSSPLLRTSTDARSFTFFRISRSPVSIPAKLLNSSLLPRRISIFPGSQDRNSSRYLLTTKGPAKSKHTFTPVCLAKSTAFFIAFFWESVSHMNPRKYKNILSSSISNLISCSLNCLQAPR